MERRDFLRLLGAGALFATTGRTSASGSSPGRRPNVILCMADDQGWGDMAYNGNPVVKTPHFDQMAAASLRFDRFYAAAPVCSPTRGSVMTGRHPNRFGCLSWGRTLRPQETTIAEALKDAGYVTGHFGKWHLGPVRAGSPLNPGASGFDEWLSAPNFFDNDPILSRKGTAVQMHGESSIVTVDAALEFIRKHAGSPRPFLAVVWFGSPHRPHRAAERFRAMYPNQSARRQNFLGEITGMDYAVGKLREELRALGIHEETLLWYCSDNGGLPEGDTGGRGTKGSIWEGGLRVPGILEWPGRIAAGRVTDMPCVTSDIYPTVLDIADALPADQARLDGVSLAPLLRGGMGRRPRPIGFWHDPGYGRPISSRKLMSALLRAQQEGREVNPHTFGEDPGQIARRYPEDTFPGHSAWLDWPWKLHRIQEEDAVRFELYNLEDDPGEGTNASATEPERAAVMEAGLEKWLRSVVHSLNGGDY
ncbi:MAG: sulfatase-like hydrolase/transferase [Candidatus Brocadiia bacterium]